MNTHNCGCEEKPNTNNGKDICEHDITYRESLNLLGWYAMLGFWRYPCTGSATVKVYQAVGETKEQAKNNLIDYMIEELKKLKTNT